ncbi:uncharacterized protein LOC125674081 [Ostrea edulis]|uniref:uncharacterized protein LOC125674081 n=1 Tax=Ostrea edulis TaxID=37623 RepID=UPI00209593F5|nr:uncharacterized protein LOC125674081 [Ostrea edulis]
MNMFSKWRTLHKIIGNQCAVHKIKCKNLSGYGGRKYGSTLVSPLKKTPTVTDSAKVREIIDSYDTFLLDLDGTLWATDHYNSIPGIPRAIEFLRKLGKQILFVTNNSFHSNSHYLHKFKTQGFEAEEDEVFGVAYVAALYLKDILNITGQVYMMGTHGMANEMDKIGLKYFGLGPDPDISSLHVDDLLNMEFRENVQAVLMGFDKDFHYNKIYKSASYLTDKNCHFVATNDAEIAVKIAPNRLQPTTGSLIQSVAVASKRNPKVVGKPHTLMFECILGKYPGTDKKRTLFVGDSLKADIRFANNVGIDSALVLTGANKVKDIQNYPDAVPTYVMPSFADLYIR